MILASDLRWNARFVALVLSTHMDRNGGSCFPSITTIQRESGLGRSTVCRALDELERTGFVKRLRGGRGRPTHYIATSATAGLALVPQRDSTSATAGHEDVQEDVQQISGGANAPRRKGSRSNERSQTEEVNLAYLDN